MSIELRDYQKGIIKACRDGYEQGLRRMLVSSPTGSGKAVVAAKIIKLASQHHRVLFLAHREELITQIIDKILMLNPLANVGVVMGDQDDHGCQIVVASVPTLARENRLHRLVPDFGTIIVDEAHHSAAKTYRDVLEYFRCFEEHGPILIGMTATPVRGDGVGLDGIYEKIICEVPLLDLIERGYLSDLRGLSVKIARDFHELRTRAGDYVDSETGAMLSAANAPAKVVTAWGINAAERPTIVFTPTVALAGEMVEAFTANGVTAAAVSGETPRTERRRILDDFKHGRTQVIANAALLTEGVDLPLTSCIVIAKPTKSQVAYSQMVGRGLRRHPGKENCLVMDVVGSTLDLELQTLSTLTGLPHAVLDQRDATVRRALLTNKDSGLGTQTLPDGRIVTVPIDLLGSGSTWIPTGTGRYVLSAGDQGAIVLAPVGDAWTALHIHGTQRVELASGADLELCQGIGEDHVRKLGKGLLVDRSAPWRLLEPSDGQFKMLRFLGIPKRTARGKTRGEISDLIGAAKAAQQFAEVA